MERLLEEGAVRAIGVCNHLQYHLEKLLAGPM
jgi:diketogulonate reductase-like aldo/keto reductase